MKTFDEKIYPDVFSNEYVFNIENIRISLITQESLKHNYSQPRSFMHFHAGYELFFCEEGKLYLNIDKEKIVLTDNEFIIISPKVSHAMDGTDKGTKIGTMYFGFAPNGVKGTLDLFSVVSKIVSDDYIIVSNADSLKDCISMIRHANKDKNVFAMFSYFHEFVVKLIEITNNVPHGYNGLKSDNSNLRLHKIQTMLHVKFSEDITIDEISKNLHLSSRQVSRIIKEAFGCTFKELLTGIRMKKAGEILLKSGTKVSEVAAMVGFNSVRGFYSAFKNHYGCLPKEYKKKMIP